MLFNLHEFVLDSNFECFAHLMKGVFCTGILAMPIAFKYSGFAVGLIGLALVVILTVYCMHILLYTHYELCKRRRVASMSYQTIAECASQEGPVWMHKYSRVMRYVDHQD